MDHGPDDDDTLCRKITRVPVFAVKTDPSRVLCPRSPLMKGLGFITAVGTIPHAIVDPRGKNAQWLVTLGRIVTRKGRSTDRDVGTGIRKWFIGPIVEAIAIIVINIANGNAVAARNGGKRGGNSRFGTRTTALLLSFDFINDSMYVMFGKIAGSM